MATYIITEENGVEEPDRKAGLVLWRGDAPHSQDAMNQWARQVLDDDLNEMIDEEYEPRYRAEKRVAIARYVLRMAADKPEVNINIYRVAVDENGDPDVISGDELEFSAY